jgi:hypothetical protein
VNRGRCRWAESWARQPYFRLTQRDQLSQDESDRPNGNHSTKVQQDTNKVRLAGR